jgi:DNA-binding response OmpR family regulator
MSTKRIVVIDDSPLVLAVATDALEAAGLEVLAAESGLDANRYIFSPTPPDLILIDVMMPLLNGDQKVRLLKERNKSRDIPVLLMSSKPTDELAALARDSGADGYIQKPFNKATLVEKVRTHLHN